MIISGDGSGDVTKREAHLPDDRPTPRAGVAIINFAIACCALTMAIVVAVAIAAAG